MVAGIALLIVVALIVYFLFFRNSADAAVLSAPLVWLTGSRLL
jgi:hypothetical protein